MATFNDLAERVSGLEVLKKIASQEFIGEVFLVGGALRELILGKLPNDYDFALSHMEDLKTIELSLGSKSFVLGKKPIHTQRIVSGNQVIDLTFLKSGIERDLARRDFTMNAIAYDVRNRAFIDTQGGIEDIKKKLIRFPGKYTLTDDPLRMLKAVRHYVLLEGFTFDEELFAAMGELKGLIHQVAPERIKYELDLIITASHVHEGIKLLEKTGILFELFPALFAMREMDEQKKFSLETYGHTILGFRYLKRFASFYGLDGSALKTTGYALLFHDLGKANTYSYDRKKKAIHFYHHERHSQEIASKIMEKLRFSTHETRAILKLIENHMRIFLISSGEPTQRALNRLVYHLGNLIPQLIALTLCDLYGSSGGKENSSTKQVRKRCDEVWRTYIDWKKKPLPNLLNGNDLIGMGFSEGPLVGKILQAIREKQIAGELKEKEEARDLARKFLKDETIENNP